MFSTYIIYDTQLIIGDGGERFSEDDYILATMCLYIDIINLFVQMLKLISKAMDDEKNKDSKTDKVAEEFFGVKKKDEKKDEDDEDEEKGKGKKSKGKKGKDDKKGGKGKGGKGKDDKKGGKGGDEKKEKKEDDESVEQKFNKQLEDLTNNLFGL